MHAEDIRGRPSTAGSSAARDRAEQLGLIRAGNVEGVTYLWLTRPETEQDED